MLAIDPDPGDAPVALETRCELQGIDVSYGDASDWQPLGENMVLGPVAEDGRYRLTVRVSDYGCRESTAEAEIVLTLDTPDPTLTR